MGIRRPGWPSPPDSSDRVVSIASVFRHRTPAHSPGRRHRPSPARSPPALGAHPPRGDPHAPPRPLGVCVPLLLHAPRRATCRGVHAAARPLRLVRPSSCCTPLRREGGASSLALTYRGTLLAAVPRPPAPSRLLSFDRRHRAASPRSGGASRFSRPVFTPPAPPPPQGTLHCSHACAR